jgi:hypothetical protein
MANVLFSPAHPVRCAFLAAFFVSAGISAALAQTAPDTENGRYSLSQSGDGYVRLDTRTGAVSTCTNGKGGWACRIVPDERAALDTEIGRLLAENKKLKEQLDRRESIPVPKADIPSVKPDADKKTAETEKKSAETDAGKSIELRLPPEHGRIMDLLDRMWRRLVEMAGLVQKKLTEKI